VSVGYTIGAFTPKASYAKGWNEKANGSTVADSGYRQYVFGVDYALSKRTTAGLSYGNAQYGAGTAEAAGTKTTFKTLSFNLAHSF
jgi:predicted porin